MLSNIYGTEQGRQPTVNHNKMNIQGDQTSGQENQTISQSNQSSELANQDQIADAKD